LPAWASPLGRLFGTDRPGFRLDLGAHEVTALHQFIEPRAAEPRRSSAEHAFDATPQNDGVDWRRQGSLPGRALVVAEKLLSEVTPGLVNRCIAVAEIQRLGRHGREQLDRVGALETPNLDCRGEGDEMQPLVKEREAEDLAEATIGLVARSAP